MKKILIVDNNIDPPYGCAEIRLGLARVSAEFGDIALISRRGPDSALPTKAEGWDGVVLSGSKTRIYENAPWIEKEMEFLRQLKSAKVPSFGICYGEQLMARTFAGDSSTGAAKINEYGWVKVEKTKEAAQCEIFSALPDTFYSFAFHSDEVYSLPKGFRHTLRSADCNIQGFSFEDAPFWGVQFHPERGFQAGKESIERKKKNDPKQKILHADLSSEQFSEEIMNHLMRGFLREVWRRA